MKRVRGKPLLWLGLTGGLLLAACGGAVATQAPTEPPAPTSPPPAATEAAPPPTEAPAAPQEGEPVTKTDCGDPFAGETVRFVTSYWTKTDFCKHSVPYEEIRPGGPPPDGIPAIDRPHFESIADADEWLGPEWPVMVFEHEGDVRAYPLAILMWHEIVNDTVGDQPVAVTFCPLCNSTIVFNRRLPDGQVVDFGTTGNLRNSDLVMYDRQTESWWQQLTAEAIVGFYTGTRLEILPSQILAWEDFKERFPEGRVLSRNTGHVRDYGRNPYTGYDSSSFPFLFSGDLDERLRATERVVAIEINGVDVAYPFSALAEVRVVNDEVGGVPIVVFWKPGTASALDAADFSNSKDVGSSGVFEREVDGQVLTFEPADEEHFRDQETGTLWDITGLGLEGPLAGTQLEKVIFGEHFWFAWAVFKPDTELWSPGG